MKAGFIKSSPHFFILITRSMLLFVCILMSLAFIIPAPLQQAADPTTTPNPVKSAWFLLWVQEVISWSRFMVYPVIFIVLLFMMLPWLAKQSPQHRACWFPQEQRGINLLTIITLLSIIVLSCIAFFMRGPNWAPAFPF